MHSNLIERKKQYRGSTATRLLEGMEMLLSKVNNVSDCLSPSKKSVLHAVVPGTNEETVRQFVINTVAKVNLREDASTAEAETLFSGYATILNRLLPIVPEPPSSRPHSDSVQSIAPNTPSAHEIASAQDLVMVTSAKRCGRRSNSHNTQDKSDSLPLRRSKRRKIAITKLQAVIDSDAVLDVLDRNAGLDVEDGWNAGEEQFDDLIVKCVKLFNIFVNVIEMFKMTKSLW